jgi:hypothetical protein
VSFAAITLCVASQRVFTVVSIYFVMDQSGNFCIHPRIGLVNKISEMTVRNSIRVFLYFPLR